MAQLHRNIKKYSPGARLTRKIIGDKNWDTAHFLGTSAVAASDARKSAERAATDAANQPVMPIADEEELARSRRKMLSRKNRGRASTILASDSETLG
jgi:hypothetical protein